MLLNRDYLLVGINSLIGEERKKQGKASFLASRTALALLKAKWLNDRQSYSCQHHPTALLKKSSHFI